MVGTHRTSAVLRVLGSTLDIIVVLKKCIWAPLELFNLVSRRLSNVEYALLNCVFVIGIQFDISRFILTKALTFFSS